MPALRPLHMPLGGDDGMTSLEYRVRWRREGRQGTSQIYQSEDGCRAKADRLMALEAVKEGSRFDDMPDLVGPPVIEVREVGAWQPAEEQPTEASEEAIMHMDEWATPGSQSGVALP